MEIPKVKGVQPSSETQTATESTRPARAKQESAQIPEAMEKPQMLSEPDRAETHPARQQQAGKPALFEKQIAELKAKLATKGSGRADVAVRALALSTAYAMRRSRGARRRAIELCEEVAASVEEHAELAARLAVLLRAEGDLHETTAEGTLRACRDLIRLLDEEPT